MNDPAISTAANSVVVKLFDDEKNKETPVNVTPALERLFAYAHHWSLAGSREDKCTLSFSAMLAAMVAGSDPLCEWLRGHLALRGVADQSVTRGRHFPTTSLPKDRLQPTSSFRQALAEARKLAGEKLLDVRHFMAAYVVAKEYHREDFLRLRIDRRVWCLELAEVLKERFPDEAVLWTGYSLRAPPVLLPGFDADLPRGADLLGVGREVEAFAMLIAGKQTLTPLSIGVFGAWGAGKSYFMARVEERVAALAAKGSPGAYLQHIAQVRFNAWHYSETNVVASLVDQIFRNLRFGPSETEQILADRQKQAMKEMAVAEDLRNNLQDQVEEAEAVEGARKEALDRVVREINEAMRAKEKELSAATAALADAQERLQRVVREQDDAIAAARRAAPAQEAAAIVTREILEDQKLKELGDGVRRVVEESRWVGLNQWTIILGVVALALTALALYAVEALREQKLVTGLVGLVAAATPIAIRWLTVLREVAARGRAYQEAVQGRTEAAIKEIKEAGAKARDQQETARKEWLTKVEQLKGEIATLAEKTHVAELALAEGEERRRQATSDLAAATADLAAKRAKLKSITSGSLLEEIVQSLGTTDAYRKELGTLARARRDFERLSERMAAARKAFDEHRSLERPVLERIVLYIDDLDRCPEENVRQLLQAVHLLLAFDLFVCVVAVDPRWVIQCLRSSPGVVAKESTPDMAGTTDSDLDVLGGVATPSDYLEKIFQIPLWLRPVPAAQRAPVIGTLLAKHLKRDLAAAEIRAGLARALEVHPRAAPGEPMAHARAVASPPDPIEIDPSEIAFLPRIAPLLDGNTRALKRFVNTYRLVKAALSDVELAYFAKIPYGVCMAQLAVLATQRRRGRVLVRLNDEVPVDHEKKLGDWLEDLGKSKDADVQSLAKDLDSALLPEAKKLPSEHFAVWLERTRRYSFYL